MSLEDNLEAVSEAHSKLPFWMEDHWDIIVFGGGWLGNKLGEYLNAGVISNLRNLGNLPSVQADIGNAFEVAQVLDRRKPKIVINAAGKTGRPNIDWCEDHREETLYANTTGPLVLFEECRKRKIYFVHISSGCIYDGDSPYIGGFRESDKPNPVSYYGYTKVFAETMLKIFPVLILRIRMPIDSEPHERNLITKLSKYENIIDVFNSVTIVEDFIYATKKLIEKKKTGIYNITNPGPVRHKDILETYKKLVDRNHEYNMISPDKLETKGGRSNCILNSDKLAKEGIVLKDAMEMIEICLREYKQRL